MQEQDVIQKIKNGDAKAFGELYDAYIGKIYDFIYYKTLHKQTAEDLTSTTFTKALAAVPSFSGNKGTFQAWLYQIARNTVIDHYRTQKHDANIEDAWTLPAGTSLETDIANRELLEQVQKALSAFSDEQRTIVILRVWQGLSYKEISEIVGKSENNCKVIFSRTIGKIRKDGKLALLLFLLTIVS